MGIGLGLRCSGCLESADLIPELVAESIPEILSSGASYITGRNASKRLYEMVFDTFNSL